ncbi:MAG: tail fiber domain-containing protein, partial [Planctomycetota bacterium]
MAPTTNATLVVEDDSEASISVISPTDEEASLFLGNANAGPNAGAVVFNPFDNSFPNGLVLRTADTNRIGITAGGDVGIGTNSPGAALHVADGATGVTPNANSKLVIEGSAGSANYVSVLGDLNEDVGVLFGNSNSPADAGLIWREGLDRLLLRAGNNETKMTIRRSGNVGIGTESPARNLHVFDGSSGTSPSTNSSLVVESSGEASISLIAPSNQEQAIFFGNAASAPNAGAILFNPFGGALPNGMILRTDDTNRIAITETGLVGINTLSPTFTFEVNGSAGKPGGGSWSVSSDARLKKNVNDLEGSLDTLLSLRGVTYEYKDPAAINELAGERTGFIAQEVEAVMPVWVEEVGGYKRLTIRGFEALTVEALRELDEENDE